MGDYDGIFSGFAFIFYLALVLAVVVLGGLVCMPFACNHIKHQAYEQGVRDALDGKVHLVKDTTVHMVLQSK